MVKIAKIVLENLDVDEEVGDDVEDLSALGMEDDEEEDDISSIASDDSVLDFSDDDDEDDSDNNNNNRRRKKMNRNSDEDDDFMVMSDDNDDDDNEDTENGNITDEEEEEEEEDLSELSPITMTLPTSAKRSTRTNRKLVDLMPIVAAGGESAKTSKDRKSIGDDAKKTKKSNGITKQQKMTSEVLDQQFIKQAFTDFIKLSKQIQEIRLKSLRFAPISKLELRVQ